MVRVRKMNRRSMTISRYLGLFVLIVTQIGQTLQDGGIAKYEETGTLAEGIKDMIYNLGIFFVRGTGNDNISPEVHCPDIPKTITAEQSSREAWVYWEPATATDNNEVELIFMSKPDNKSGLQPGSMFPEGKHIVEYIALDTDKNYGNCRVVFEVKVIRCPRLGNPKHGNMQCDDPNATRQIYGHRCSFSCDEGYDLIGRRDLDCDDDGNWNALAPECKKIACPHPKLNKRVEIGKCDNEGRVCSVICEQGYKFDSGSDSNHLIACENGSWDISVPACIKQECPPPPIPSNTDLDSCSDDNRFESVCVFVCRRGYKSTRPGATSNHAFCANNQKWIGPYHSCTEISCPPLPWYDNKSQMTKESCTDDYKFRSTCKYKCKEGYEPHIERDSFRNFVTCQENGQWEGTLDKCKKVKCPAPDTPRNTVIEKCSDGHRYNSTCSLTCAFGLVALYKNNSALRNVTCRSDRTWELPHTECAINWPVPVGFLIGCAMLGKWLYSRRKLSVSNNEEADYPKSGDALSTRSLQSNTFSESSTESSRINEDDNYSVNADGEYYGSSAPGGPDTRGLVRRGNYRHGNEVKPKSE